MIVVRLYGQFHLSGMVCYHPAAVIPADFIDGFAEGVEGKHRKGGEHRSTMRLRVFEGKPSR